MKRLPLNIEPGQIVAIDGIEHVFERIDRDGRVTLRTMHSENPVDFEVTDAATGFGRKPDADDIARLMASGCLVIKSKDLEEGPRRAARKRELDAKTAYALDPNAKFRIVFVREYDRTPCGLSDRALRNFNERLLTDPEIAKLPGARLYSGSTQREWIHKRGHGGDRRARDGIAMPGGKRGRQVAHPREILEHYLALAVGRKTVSTPGAKARALKGWQDYAGELNRINRGQPTGRQSAAYPIPSKPYRPVSYTTFWRMCRDLESSATFEAQHGHQAVYQRYGGGGQSVRHTRLGAFGQMDDTPAPAVFLVDDERGIPLGQATVSLLSEDVSTAIIGWQLGWDDASSATALETYAHANTPKVIPKDIDELHPELKWICTKLSAVLVDNLSGHHARHFEDSMLDAGTDVHFAGAHMPRDKARKERLIGTILDLAFKDLPAATYDIARAREFGFDPTTMVMISIRKANELLVRAVCVHNLSPSKALDGRSPALKFFQLAAKHGVSVIDDLDEFRRGIGNVEYDAQLRNSGVVVKGLRYSDARLTRALVDDLVSLQSPTEAKRTKQHTFTVKVKYSQSDMGRVHVWNQRTKRYVTLPAANLEYAEGMPLWAHKRIAAIAKLDMLEFNHETEETDGHRLIEIRKRLFEEIRNITPDAAERDRATLAKLRQSPLFRRVVGEIVEAVDEAPSDLVQPNPADAPDYQLADGLGAPHRADATIPTPRPRRSKTGREAASTPAARRSQRNDKARDPRDAGTTAQPAAVKPVGAAPKTNLKWGQTYD